MVNQSPIRCAGTLQTLSGGSSLAAQSETYQDQDKPANHPA